MRRKPSAIDLGAAFGSVRVIGLARSSSHKSTLTRAYTAASA